MRVFGFRGCSPWRPCGTEPSHLFVPVYRKGVGLKIDDRRPLQVVLVFLWGGFLLYLSTFGNSWSYDDFLVVVHNPDITSFQAFLTDCYPGRPLRELSFLVDYQLFGLDSVGWHIQNVLWHSLNAWLVFKLARHLSADIRIAWIASLLFLIHPVQVEVVAQTSHRKDSLALFFILTACLAYFHALQAIGRQRMFLILSATAAVVVACFAKKNALVTPLVFVLYETLFIKRDEQILLKHRSFLIIVGVVLLGVIWWVVPFNEYVDRATFQLVRNSYLDGFSLEIYLLTVVKSWGMIFSKLAWPHHLAINYLIETPSSWADMEVVASLGVLFASLMTILRFHARLPLIAFSLSWALLFYLPTANLWPLSWFAADRYLYTPSVGVFLATAWLFCKVFPDKKTFLFLIPLFALLAALTYRQSQVWSDNPTLWSNALRVSPQSSRVISAAGYWLHPNDPEKAMQFQLAALKINPHDVMVNYVLGEIYEQTGRTEQALVHYRKFLNPKFPMYQVNYRKLVLELRDRFPELSTETSQEKSSNQGDNVQCF